MVFNSGAQHHAYPLDLASRILELWTVADPISDDPESEAGGPTGPLPDTETLVRILSACYQASLLREEDRPVTFRLILSEPDRFDAESGPPEGLHRLLFTEPRPFNAYELQRLSPAADFTRSLLGMSADPGESPCIWGMVHSGTRWMQSVYGGRKIAPPLPAYLVIHVSGPGRIAVFRGSTLIATLDSGRINSPSLNVFMSRWLRESFAETRNDLRELYLAARRRCDVPGAILDDNFVRMLSQQVVKRIISTIRDGHHGGTLIYLPHEQVPTLLAENRYMTIKYRFVEEEPRQRLRTLFVRIMNTFSEVFAEAAGPGGVIGWHEYVTCTDVALAHTTEALFEVAHLIAGLASVDGAVVMSKKHELIGFGAVISGDIDKVETVARALDIEGDRTVPEKSDWVGTRHRAAYRLCHELHDAIAIVVSKDGTVRVIKWHDGAVTYWDQVPMGMKNF
jgi:hypothetical protein